MLITLLCSVSHSDACSSRYFSKSTTSVDFPTREKMNTHLGPGKYVQHLCEVKILNKTLIWPKTSHFVLFLSWNLSLSLNSSLLWFLLDPLKIVMITQLKNFPSCFHFSVPQAIELKFVTSTLFFSLFSLFLRSHYLLLVNCLLPPSCFSWCSWRMCAHGKVV